MAARVIAVALAAVAAVAAAASNPLGPYNIDPSLLTVGGLSSGAFMAVQFHVAFSSQVAGASIFAGGPYLCAQDSEVTALTTCMSPNLAYPAPDPATLEGLTLQAYQNDNIDDPRNMTDARVHIYSGTDDSVVATSVVQALETYYQYYVTEGTVQAEYSIPSGHCYPTLNYGETCDLSESPYIGNCQYDGAGAALKVLYPTLKSRGTANANNLMTFDQTQFVENPAAISMGDTGYIYVASSCLSGTKCGVHVSFHGCEQTLADINAEYPQNVGLNEWAETNDLIILYPQVIKSQTSPANPNGCWDWWGYTDSSYAYRSGAQMQVVKAMIDALAQSN